MVSSSPSPTWCPDMMESEDIDAMRKDLEDPLSRQIQQTTLGMVHSKFMSDRDEEINPGFSN